MNRSSGWKRVHPSRWGVALASMCLLISGCAQQPTAPTSPAPPPPPAEAAPSMPAASPAAAPAQALDPGIIETLDRMGSYLRSLQAFELQASSDTDAILDNDQMAQFSRWATMKVRRPNRLRADIRDDGGDRKIFYFNGKTFTVFDPDNKYYATVDAPPTLGEMAKVLAERYGIELPLADLFYWDSNKVDAKAIKSADFLGYAEVDGRMTTHFALRQEGVDWQIWVERGASPLPRKLVITSTSEAARPQHSVRLRWNLAPKLSAGEFDFKPPPGAHRIDIRTTEGVVEKPGN